MSDDQDLRKRLIRLAAENPELQPKLLPLLKQAAQEQLATKAVAKGMATKVKGVVDGLANLTFDDVKPSRHADSAAKHLTEAHKALVLLGRNL